MYFDLLEYEEVNAVTFTVFLSYLCPINELYIYIYRD